MDCTYISLDNGFFGHLTLLFLFKYIWIWFVLFMFKCLLFKLLPIAIKGFKCVVLHNMLSLLGADDFSCLFNLVLNVVAFDTGITYSFLIINDVQFCFFFFLLSFTTSIPIKVLYLLFDLFQNIVTLQRSEERR